ADMNLFIFGASTMGEMALDVARAADVQVAGFIDDVSAALQFCGLPVCDSAKWIRESRGDATVIIAIGGNEGRARVTWLFRQAGVPIRNLIDPRAHIERSATLGGGNLIMAGAYVGTGVTIGDGNLLLPGACLTHHNRVADFNFFAPGVAV